MSYKDRSITLDDIEVSAPVSVELATTELLSAVYDKHGPEEYVEACIDILHADLTAVEVTDMLQRILEEITQPDGLYLKGCPHCKCGAPIVHMCMDEDSANFTQYKVICDAQRSVAGMRGCGSSSGSKDSALKAAILWNNREDCI